MPTRIYDAYNFVKYSIYALFVWFGLNNEEIEMTKLLFILMIIDTIFGVLKSIRLKYKINHKRLIWGVISKFGFLVVPLLVAKIGFTMEMDFKLGVDFVLWLLVANEFLSIVANIQSIRLNKLTQNLDLISIGFDLVKKGAIKWVQSKVKVFERIGGCEDELSKINNDEDNKQL